MKYTKKLVLMMGVFFLYIVISCGFGTAVSYQQKKLTGIRQSYHNLGISTYDRVPLVPVGFLVDEHFNKSPYIRDWYENPTVLLERLSRNECKVTAYIIAIEGKPLIYSKKRFMKILAIEATNNASRQKDNNQPLAPDFEFSRWWNTSNDSIILLAEKTRNP